MGRSNKEGETRGGTWPGGLPVLISGSLCSVCELPHLCKGNHMAVSACQAPSQAPGVLFSGEGSPSFTDGLAFPGQRIFVRI